MRPTLFALILLAATATPILAQAQAQRQFPVPSAATMRPSPPQIFTGTNGGTCPIRMTAQRQDAGQTLWTIALEDEQGPTTMRPGDAGVHVELTGFREKAIQQVKLAVYFLPRGSRAVPVTESETGTTSDLKRTFDLAAPDGFASKLVGDLLVRHAASITHVRLLSISYADGSTWRTSSSASCNIEPNRFILVGSR
jgi:hypothetical protein